MPEKSKGKDQNEDGEHSRQEPAERVEDPGKPQGL